MALFHNGCDKFQSTLPRGERLGDATFTELPTGISIHAPTRGATKRRMCDLRLIRFQSTLPRGERHDLLNEITKVENFNPRSHEGSDDGWKSAKGNPVKFQSTLPRGERPSGNSKNTYTAKFQSTLPRGERPPDITHTLSNSDFNPRSHEGSDAVFTSGGTW